MNTPQSPPTATELTSQPLMLFDGVCGLCNWFVDFIMRRDRRGRFRFAPLQGETARSVLPPEETQDLKTVVVIVDGRAYRYSAAIVRVLWQLGGIWAIAGSLLWLIPQPLRDWGYRVVARNRYRWFGQKDTCRMPTPEERARLLP
ncbi:MAG: DUF393 domain-containing protein [Planctomycetaceae bacterium]|nr:DUF393 domain-containing protein [Planctomycetaceae bacterium]